MPYTTKIIRLLDRLEPTTKEVLLAVLEEIEKQREESVTKNEFNELKEIVRDLANAQKETEERLQDLTIKVNELTEAQKKTEERVQDLTKKVDALAEAQKKTEERVQDLTKKVDALVSAQKETEEKLQDLAKKVDELAEAQKKTEEMVQNLTKNVDELTEAQKKTEEEIRELAVGLKITREQLGGLSRSVSYALENEAYRKVPKFLEKKFGFKIIDRIIRTEIENEEINFFGKAKKDNKEIILVGESVLKLDDKSKLNTVLNKVNIIKQTIGGEVVPIIITHFAKKKILERAEKAGIIVIQSFEWV